jgi:hypothetical protein
MSIEGVRNYFKIDFIYGFIYGFQTSAFTTVEFIPNHSHGTRDGKMIINSEYKRPGSSHDLERDYKKKPVRITGLYQNLKLITSESEKQRHTAE